VQESRALVVRHATVLDTRTAKTLPDRAIVMCGDRIIRVVADSALDTLRGDLRGAQVLDVRGRLVIPGLIDVHHHTAYVFPDSITPGGGAVSRLVMRADSIASYRARWASA
jgi:imidazolonepropionase-like amidohydrolase